MNVNWHRLFGLLLSEYFADTVYDVELEVDLSVKVQLLDVVVLRRRAGPPPEQLADGLDLADFNLLTFKSMREPLTDWSLKELIGHYVNYRKQISPSFDDLLPEDRFRLFAACARFPLALSKKTLLDEVPPGVYDINWGTDRIRLIVLSRVPQAEHNALFNLFSADVDAVKFGAEHVRRSRDVSSLIYKLYDTISSRAFQCRTRSTTSCGSSSPSRWKECRPKNASAGCRPKRSSGDSLRMNSSAASLQIN